MILGAIQKKHVMLVATELTTEDMLEIFEKLAENKLFKA